MDRMHAVVLVMVVVETAWTLLCAETSADIFLYYGGLIVASAAFWVPGVVEPRRQTA